MAGHHSREYVDDVRRFNRFYTRRIGALEEAHLPSSFSLTEVRVIYELAQSAQMTASALREKLELDAGYLSRILLGFEKRGLIRRKSVEGDGRARLLSLSARGRAAFAKLDAEASTQIEGLLGELSEQGRQRLLGAMHSIEGLLSSAAGEAPCTLRAHRPGDMGWVIERHGALYHAEYGWDARFEALVTDVVADFLHRHDPRRERCWIAERHGERVGCVMLVNDPSRPAIAKLRLLLVEPSARGLGLGRQLVGECTRFAREAGYDRITLWTNSILDAARHLYEQEGYRLVQEEHHAHFGEGLIGQTWELDLER